MPRAQVRSPSSEELSWEPEEAPPARISRPSAPPLRFGRSTPEAAEVAVATPAAAVAPAAAAAAAPAPEPVPPDKVRCSQCGALSPSSYRFCISCGAVLKKAAFESEPAPARARPADGAPAAARSRPAISEGAKEAKPPPSRQRPPPPPRSKPAPVVAESLDELEDIAPLEVECTRCGGACQLGEKFCKHCGATLPRTSDGAVEHPAPAREAPRARSDSGRPDAPVELVQKVADGEPFPLADSAVKNRGAERIERMRAAARPEVTGKLVVIVEDGSEGRALELSGRQVDIGSADGDIVLTEDRYLSPRHARFFRQEGHWYLRDLESVNGVYRRLRKPTPLRDGDLVLLGLEVLEFDLVDHAERGLGHAIQHGVLVFGSPATTRRARLCQRTVEGVTRDVYHLVSDETTIGRETGDIVFTSDPFMSRRHAMITWDDEAQHYVLTDLNSSNGTYLAIRDDVRLENGDYIRLGQHLFRVDLPRSKAR